MTKVESIDDVTIRLASNDDGERIRTLVFGVLDEFGLPSDPAGKDADLNDIEGSYLRPGGTFEVIEDKEGALVGTYGLYPLDQEPSNCGRCISFRKFGGWAWAERSWNERL